VKGPVTALEKGRRCGIKTMGSWQTLTRIWRVSSLLVTLYYVDVDIVPNGFQHLPPYSEANLSLGENLGSDEKMRVDVPDAA
jgi:hypothetical protein